MDGHTGTNELSVALMGRADLLPIGGKVSPQ